MGQGVNFYSIGVQLADCRELLLTGEGYSPANQSGLISSGNSVDEPVT